MISITATLFLALAFSTTEANSFYSQKTIPQDSFSAYHGGKLPELEYYDDYEQLQSLPNVVVIYPILPKVLMTGADFTTFSKVVVIHVLPFRFTIFMKKLLPLVQMVFEY